MKRRNLIMRISGFGDPERRIGKIEKMPNTNNNTHRENLSQLHTDSGNHRVGIYKKSFADFLKECELSDDSGN